MFALVIIGPGLSYLWLMIRRPSDRSVAAFAKTYAVPLTSSNVEQVRSYIQWVRRWRAGATLTVLVSTTGAADALDREPISWWFPIVIGYGIGTLAGELLRPVERRPDAARATLESRRICHFVVPHFLVAVGVVFAASVVPAVFLLVDNPTRPWRPPPSPNELTRPQDWFVVLLAGISAAATATGLLGARVLARAPLPADTSDRLAVRHAVRSAAIMAVVGAAVMVSGAVGAKLAGTAGSLDQGALLVVQALNGVAVGIGALGTLWGAMLTLNTIPRFAPFSGALPAVPRAVGSRST
jgi:hypothetical protein